MKPNPHRLLTATLASVLFTLGIPTTDAQVPGLLNYQGKVTVGATAFQGSGQFKFALVSSDGSVTYWSNDGSSVAGGAPTAAVALNVVNGLYTVQLGDAALPNMTAVPAAVFSNPDVRLRVWFNDGTNGFERITPDQRITAVGYAMTAATVPDGSITGAKIAPGAIGSAQLGPNLNLSGTVTAGSFAGDGSGLTGLPTGGSGLAWSTTAGTTQAASANSGYIAENAAQILYTLPTTASVGASVRITGSGAGGFKVVAGAGHILQKGALGGAGLTTTWNSASLDTSDFYPEGSPGRERIRVSSDGTKMLMLGYNEVLRSGDAGETWTNTPQSQPEGGELQPYRAKATADLTTIYQPVTIFTDSGYFYRRFYLSKSTDSGATWADAPVVLPGGLDVDGDLYAMELTADGTGMWVFANFGYDPETNTQDYRLYSSADSGATWTQSTLPPGALTDPATDRAFQVGRNDVSRFLFASVSDDLTHYYKTTDSGVTWTEIPVPDPSPGHYSEAIIANDDFSKLALLKQQEIDDTDFHSSVVSTDSGSTWITTSVRDNPPRDHSMYNFSASADFQTLALTEETYNDSLDLDEHSVRLSTDGGASWQALNGPVFSSPYDEASALRISPDGTKLWATNGDSSASKFYRTTLNLTGNYAIVAKQWASIEFQYLGNGNWAPITVTGSAITE